MDKYTSQRHVADDRGRVISVASGIGLLHQLAHLYGVQIAHYDVAHRRQYASAESLLAILNSLGAPVNVLRDVPSAWRQSRQDQWQQVLEPVVVAWDGGPLTMTLRLPSHMANTTLVGHLIMETGEQQSWKWDGAELSVSEGVEVEGTYYIVKYLLLPSNLPWGYHRFILEMPDKTVETLIISAPIKAYSQPEEPENRTWGVFLPLYALHTRQSWGSGDFSDLQSLIEWVTEIGGSVVGTLPLLATFLDKPFEPSPYVPVSRLMWNEFYINIASIPELQESPSAKDRLLSPSFVRKLEAMRVSTLVDYHQQMVSKRQILEELARHCFTENSGRLENLRQFADTHPAVEEYARFRATCEKHRSSWISWPQSLREGIIKEGDYDEDTKRYFLYAQWIAHQQFATLAEKARDNSTKLYLDFPLGVHPDGYDVWRERSLFAMDASIGAPPDIAFTKGQNWGFPPMHPERLRQKGYSYYIACIQHHLQHAGILRIDHVMGLHRLFCIPKGMEASQGTYVRYRSEEFYAILTLESHRHKAAIVGEDLGIVPSYVRPAMKRHGLNRMYVVQFELLSDLQKIFRKVPAEVVASIDTHDTPPFASFWQGLDIEYRLDLGHLDEITADMERKKRQTLMQSLSLLLKHQGWADDSSTETILKACLAFLSTSQAQVILINLEDLWLEKEPQNIPATGEECPNWRRKARYNLETFSNMPEVVNILKEIDQLRKRKPIQPGTKAVSFYLDAPEATSVALVGDFNNWNPNARQLRRGKEGLWKGVLRLAPGVYQYKFLVNGSEWREDPVNPKREPNNYGTMNSVYEVV